jgi:hypothetical protein
MLTGLPYSVQNWLLNSGIIGRQKIYALRLQQTGVMRTKPGKNKWLPMRAEQYFTIEEPAFIWRARIALMPMITITARDRYINGHGEMKIKILSLIQVANSKGHKVDQGTLQRYLAEICWFPSAALSTYIKWDTIDDSTATATMVYKGISGSVTFYFTSTGDIKRCIAERFMNSDNSASLEKWEVISKEYGFMNGIRVPVKSEVTWKLKAGDFTWLKLEITEIEYNKSLQYQKI